MRPEGSVSLRPILILPFLFADVRTVTGGQTTSDREIGWFSDSLSALTDMKPNGKAEAPKKLMTMEYLISES